MCELFLMTENKEWWWVVIGVMNNNHILSFSLLDWSTHHDWIFINVLFFFLGGHLLIVRYWTSFFFFSSFLLYCRIFFFLYFQSNTNMSWSFKMKGFEWRFSWWNCFDLVHLSRIYIRFLIFLVRKTYWCLTL